MSLLRAIFAALFDDAAVFPPGNSPLDAAVANHRRLRRSSYADLVGPLLLPAAAIPAAADLAGLADIAADPLPPGGATRDQSPEDEAEQDDGPLGVAVIARLGADLTQLVAATTLAHNDPRLDLRGVELGWQDDWRELDLQAPAIVLELPRGTEQALALTDIATAIAQDEVPGRRHLAKFRTGRTETWDWPAERELAHVIQDAIAMEIPLKLTGGLHHAVRGTLADGEHHGLLNVLACVAAARVGRPVDALAAILAQRTPDPLIASLASLGPTSVTRLRADFAAYGCCDVREPIGELTDLVVLEGDR